MEKKIRDLKEINFPNSYTYIGRNGFVKSVLGSVEVAILDLVGKLKDQHIHFLVKNQNLQNAILVVVQ